ncbi:MAG TPA: hypothetical protein VFW06_01130 [Acidimicrobiia bacterium]|nr:hypothetical protein [Acidimicrobiia bacterium]
MTYVGVLDEPPLARVDSHGGVAFLEATWVLDWWIGGDDRWYVPRRETTVRQALVDDRPVVRTAVRIPGGDAVQYVYGAGGTGDADPLVVVEIENDSPAPFVVAFVARHVQAISVDGAVARIDRRPAIVMPRAPSRWSVATGRSTEFEVLGGAAREGPFPATRDRAARVEAALLHPIPHRGRLRIAVGTGRSTCSVADLAALPAPADAARAWTAMLDRGMRVNVPDPHVMSAVDAARADALLAGGLRRPSGDVVAALEDWGFDSEAAAAWRRLPGRERRRARTRPTRPARWDEVATLAGSGAGPALLLALRGMLAYEPSTVTEGDPTITILADLPVAWRGQPVEVHAAPTRRGPVSFAVRWHGARAAVLWDAPAGTRLVAPGLDPSWSTTEPAGEALLAAPA